MLIVGRHASPVPVVRVARPRPRAGHRARRRPNGVGKTNLLESLHVATQGFSPRTRQDAQLIRFGEAAGARRGRGRRGTSPLEISLTLRQGQAKEARAERRAPAVGRVAAPRGRDARLHPRPAGGRQGRAGGPPRVLRPRARPAAPGARRRAAGLPRDARAAERRAAARAARALGRRRARAVDGAHRRRSAPQLVERAARGARRARAGVRRARRRARAAGRAARLRRGAADRGGDSRRGSHAISSAATTGLGPHLDDVLIASGDRDLRQFGSQGEQRLAVLSLLLAEAELLPTPPLLLLDDVLSELDLGRRRVLAERVAGMGQTVITATHARRCRSTPAQLVEVEAWIRSVSEIRARALARFGPQAGMAELVERWPEAVGPAIARNAWPARIATDGTVHVNTADSVWAFELGQPRRRDRRAARRAAACASRRGRCRSPIRAAARRAASSVVAGGRASAPARSPPRSRTKSCAKVCKKRSVWGSHGSAATARSDTLPVPRKTLVLQAFLSYGEDPGKGRLLGQGHHRARRPRAGPPAPGHVHRLDRHPRASTTWSTRSSTTPSTRRSRATTTRSR